MIYTPNLNLQIPEYTDPASIIDALRDNLTRLDSLAGELAAENEALRQELANKANIGKTAMYDLELQGNAQARYGCKYGKNQFGEVIVHFSVLPKEGESLEELIAVLPEGYRPEYYLVSVCFISSGRERRAASMDLSPNGEIRIYTELDNVLGAYGTVIFTAQ